MFLQLLKMKIFLLPTMTFSHSVMWRYNDTLLVQQLPSLPEPLPSQGPKAGWN